MIASAPPTTPNLVSSSIRRQCQPSSASKTSRSAMPLPSTKSTVLLLKQLAPRPSNPTVAISIPQTSLLLQLALLPPRPLRPLALEPLGEAAQQARPPRQLPQPWLLCETSGLAHSRLAPASSLVPFSKKTMPWKSRSAKKSTPFGDANGYSTLTRRLLDDLCILYLCFSAFYFSIGVVAAASALSQHLSWGFCRCSFPLSMRRGYHSAILMMADINCERDDD